MFLNGFCVFKKNYIDIIKTKDMHVKVGTFTLPVMSQCPSLAWIRVNGGALFLLASSMHEYQISL